MAGTASVVKGAPATECGNASKTLDGKATLDFVSRVALMTASQLDAAVASYDPRAFVDSVGIVERFSDGGFTRRRALLAALGAHHVRAALGELHGNARAMANVTDICRHGMTIDLLMDRFHSLTEVNSVISSLPKHCVISLEGPNENDNPRQGVQYDPSFSTDLPVYMASLKHAFPRFRIIAPALTSTASYAALRDISADADFGNMHDYSPGFNPGSVNGWGGRTPPNSVCCYGSVAWNIANAQLAVPGKPVASTEAGYCTAILHGCLPADVQAKYIPRLLLVHWTMGVPFTYIFALQAVDSKTSDGSLALVGTNGVPFPAYYCVQYLQRAMQGEAPDVDPIVIRGGDSTVRHATMREKSGKLHVAMWLETASYDPNANAGTGARIAVPPQTVRIDTGSGARSGTLTSCNVARNDRSLTRPVALASGSATIKLTDAVQVLNI